MNALRLAVSRKPISASATLFRTTRMLCHRTETASQPTRRISPTTHRIGKQQCYRRLYSSSSADADADAITDIPSSPSLSSHSSATTNTTTTTTTTTRDNHHHHHHHPLFINAIGDDRFDIVSNLTKNIQQIHGITIVEDDPPTAIWLGDHFSLTMMVEVPEEKIVDLVWKMRQLDHSYHPTVYDARGKVTL